MSSYLRDLSHRVTSGRAKGTENIKRSIPFGVVCWIIFTTGSPLALWVPFSYILYSASCYNCPPLGPKGGDGERLSVGRHRGVGILEVAVPWGGGVGRTLSVRCAGRLGSRGSLEEGLVICLGCCPMVDMTSCHDRISCQDMMSCHDMGSCHDMISCHDVVSCHDMTSCHDMA